MTAPAFTLESRATHTYTRTDPNDNEQTQTLKAFGGFTVLAFEGEERISQPFEYRLTLEFSLLDRQLPIGIDFGSVVNQEATLKLDASLSNDDAQGVIKGVVSNFRVLKRNADNTLKCEAVLVPKLWRLSLFRRSRVFQGKNVVEIVREVLTHGAAAPGCADDPGSSSDLSSPNSEAPPPLPPGALVETADFVFRLNPDPTNASSTPSNMNKVAIPEKYITREHVVQYQETDLDFVQRLLEEEGIYYYFEAGKLILADDKTQLGPASPPQVDYMGTADSESATEGSIYQFVSNERIVPATVVLNDIDTESFSVVQQNDSDKRSVGGMNGDYARLGMYTELGRYAVDKRPWLTEQSNEFSTKEVAAYLTARKDRLNRVATIRAEEIEAQREIDEGASASNRIRPGHLFTLDNHFLSDGTYLVTSVRHTYSFANDDPENDLIYRNEFECIPRDTQFRPARLTPVPRLPGIMTARVKGNGANKPDPVEDLKDPYIDNEGRYRVRFPFEAMPDAVDVNDGDNDPTNDPDPVDDPSPPVRLAQPYAGKDYGMHFPNMAGAEMVFACIDGDLSQPIGLGMVPNPRFHSPVPNRAHTMRTQTPWSGAIMGDHTNYNVKDAFYFDKRKNVIRSKLGHQIVLDDNDGGANVGITLQAGKKDNGKGKNVYWFSRIDMGGYRVKSGVEQVIDGMTEVSSWLAAGFSRDFMEFASLGLAVAQSVEESGDYFADTYGNTTPVGVGIRTDQAVSINGANGVNIVSPNFFGMFSGGLVGDDPGEKSRQHYLEVITKAINDILFRSFFKTLVDEVKEAKERAGENHSKTYPNPKARAFFKWKTQFKKARAKSFVYTLFQRTGVNVKSAGDLNLSSLQSANMVAGSGGIGVKTSGDLEQKAQGGIEINAHQGISITTAGRKYTGEGWDQVLEGIAQVAPPLVAAIKTILDKKMSKSKPDVDACPLSLENESGDITFATKYGGDIHSQAGGGGGIINLVEDGIYLTRSPEKVVSEVGYKNDKLDEPIGDAKKSVDIDSAAQDYAGYQRKLNLYNLMLKKWTDNRKERDPGDQPKISEVTSAIGSRIEQTNKKIDVFAKEEVTLSVHEDDSESVIKIVQIDNANSQIVLKCGDSSLVLESGGTITLVGNKIDVKTTQDALNIKSAAALKVEATAALELKGKGATLNGKPAAVSIEGTSVDVKGQKAAISGQAVTIG